MSEDSTVRSEPSDRDQSTKGDVRPGKPSYSQLPSTNHESPTPLQRFPTYAVHSSELLQRRSLEYPQPDNVPFPHADHVITFYNHPSCLVPLATLDHELEIDLAVWYWRKYPAAGAPGLGNVFFADRLLTLLTHFTHQSGSTPRRDCAMALTQLVCIRTLEGFETPTMYRSLQVPPCFYYGLRLVLHEHRNHPVQLLPHGDIGRLSSWTPCGDDVILKIQLAAGGWIQRRLSWQDACDPASTLISFPPLFKRETTAHTPPLPTHTTVEEEMQEKD